MRIILAVALPFVLFFTLKKPFHGFICLLLQMTLIGWLPAAIWATHALRIYKLQHIPQSPFKSAKQQWDDLPR